MRTMEGDVMQSRGSAKDAEAEKQEQAERLAGRLARIKRKIVVLSGKGGVGKSTVAANLATSLAQRGFDTGLLDVDIHGPSIPRLLGLGGKRIMTSADGVMVPVVLGERLKVMSMGFLLGDDDEAVIWRGPLKMGVIRQFLSDVEWGELDYLVVDAPPGTGDEPLSIAQLIGQAGPIDGAVIVTTPQDLALADVLVENMSVFACPHCGKETAIFKEGGGEALARRASVRFLGRIPIDPAVTEASDDGRPYVSGDGDTPCRRAFEAVAEGVLSAFLEVGTLVRNTLEENKACE